MVTKTELLWIRTGINMSILLATKDFLFFLRCDTNHLPQILSSRWTPYRDNLSPAAITHCEGRRSIYPVDSLSLEGCGEGEERGGVRGRRVRGVMGPRPFPLSGEKRLVTQHNNCKTFLEDDPTCKIKKKKKKVLCFSKSEPPERENITPIKS